MESIFVFRKKIYISTRSSCGTQPTCNGKEHTWTLSFVCVIIRFELNVFVNFKVKNTVSKIEIMQQTKKYFQNSIHINAL